jgi:hypothetical protein
LDVIGRELLHLMTQIVILNNNEAAAPTTFLGLPLLLIDGFSFISSNSNLNSEHPRQLFLIIRQTLRYELILCKAVTICDAE